MTRVYGNFRCDTVNIYSRSLSDRHLFGTWRRHFKQKLRYCYRRITCLCASNRKLLEINCNFLFLRFYVTPYFYKHMKRVPRRKIKSKENRKIYVMKLLQRLYLVNYLKFYMLFVINLIRFFLQKTGIIIPFQRSYSRLVPIRWTNRYYVSPMKLMLPKNIRYDINYPVKLELPNYKTVFFLN